MECANLTKYSWVDLAFSVIGVCTFLVDWGSDIWVATEFYCRGDVLWFGVLVGLMALSSVVVQMFSWFWFQYDREFSGPGGDAQGGGSVLMFGDRVKLSCLLHVLQLGFLWSSSLVYFLWNLLLISPRVASLALFSSVLSSFIALHFALLWVVFVAWVWRQKTDFMDSHVGEWLYRATVGLIWYFSWFNVAEGRTRGRSVIYHSFITADCAILLTTWWLYRDPIESQSYSLALIISLPLVYISGLLLKTLYYCCFHPKLWRPPQRDPGLPKDLPDSKVTFRDMPAQDGTLSQPLVNKRMALLATNFYSERRELESATTRKKTELYI